MSAATDAGALRPLQDDVSDLVPVPVTTLIRRRVRDDVDHVCDGTDPWRRAHYDEWAGRLGAARMHGHLRALDDQFHCLLLMIVSEASDEALHRRAHDVASTAGMLGFDEVTRRCRVLLEPSVFVGRLSARKDLGDALRHAIARLDLHFSEEACDAAA